MGHYWLSIPDHRGQLQYKGWHGSIDQVRWEIQREHERRRPPVAVYRPVPNFVEEVLRVFPMRLP